MLMKLNFLFTVCLFPAVVWGQRSPQGSWFVDGNKDKFENRSHTSVESFEQGMSVIYATNGTELYLTQLRMNKTSGGINDDKRRENGVNSALLADGGCMVYVDQCTVTSHAPQADGITMSGQGTKAILTRGKVTTNRQGSAGICSINEAEIDVTKTDIHTIDHQSPCFYASNNGKLLLTEATSQSAGQASPLFNTKGGIIETEKCRMSSGQWTIGSVFGGKMELNTSELKSGGVSGFLIYDTDKERKEKLTEGTLVLRKNTLSIGEGPLILITNAYGNVFLTGNKISCRNDVIIALQRDDWGPKGYNQGEGVIELEKQTLSGDIFVDSLSSVELKLHKSGKLYGRITGDPTDMRTVRVHMGKGSMWSAKGDVYITSIEFDQPLKKGLKQLKGRHTIWYDPADPANAPLEGKEYKTGGGMLRPIK